MLRRDGFMVNHKRFRRIYRSQGLELRARRKRGVRYIRGNAVAPLCAKPYTGRWTSCVTCSAPDAKFRALTIVDDFTRESISVEVTFSLTGDRVVRILSRLAAERGLPPTFKFDNGSEFTSYAMLGWGRGLQRRAALHRPGRPMQNGTLRASTAGFATSCSTSMFSNDLPRCDRGLAY